VLLIERLRLSPDVERTAIGFMGCYAGFAAMRTVDRIVRADPRAVVLSIAVELCSLHLQYDTLIANLLFSDGAAACVWSRRGDGPAIAAVRSRVPPGTLERMSWRIGDHGFVMTLDDGVPAALGAEAPAFARAFGGDRDPAYAVHPGGKKILDAVSRALALPSDALDTSRAVLRDFGNMSSAAIFFVLERELRLSSRPVVALGFGPGLTMEGVLFER
jgi:predicted naringenin-chalcone synthase